MNPYRLTNWPFPADATACVHWICSPRKEGDAKVTTVYFRTNDPGGEPIPVTLPWGLIPELWIGREFQNGSPMDSVSRQSFIIDLNLASISQCSTADAVDVLYRRHYPLEIPEIFHERCAWFVYKNFTVIIPCIELLRAFMMKSSFLANQLLTSGGLYDLFIAESWHREGGKIQFDLNPTVANKIPEKLISTITAISEIDVLKTMWEKAYAQYAAERKFDIAFPCIPGLKLACSARPDATRVFITHIANINISCPFDEINYGPKSDKASSHPDENKHIVLTAADKPDMVEIGEPAATARSGIVERIPAATSCFSFTSPVSVNRIRSDISFAAKKSTKKIGVEQSPYSPNDQTGSGELPAIDFTPDQEASHAITFSADPNFQKFGQAIALLTRNRIYSLVSSSTDLLTSVKRYAYTEHGEKRRYALAEIRFRGKTWLIIEISLSGDYSISTLLIQCDNTKKDQLVKHLLNKLDGANGHWSKDCFCTDMHYRTLDHRSDRTAKRWAELLASKMN